MSKYQQRGAYHYDEFRRPQSIYRAHVLDLIAQLERFLPKDLLLPKVIEVGAGEGLILREIQERMGLECLGCDLDPTAVLLAKQLGNKVELGTIDVFKGETADVVLLCDVLEHVESPIAVMAAAREHVESPIAVMAAARELAPMVVIAVPDRRDPHAIHVVEPDVVKGYMEPSGYDCVYQSQRHARHLLIFKRRADDSVE